jgi:putative membrane protein
LRSQSENIWQSVFAGALGGLAASYAMNQFQSLLSKAAKGLSDGRQENEQSGGEGEDATVKTAKAISQNLFHHQLTESEKKWAGPVVHYSFGTLVGAAYGLLAETAPAFRASYGTVYGTAVWLAADEIGVPAAGLAGPPLETPATSHMKAFASHIVYGVTAELVRRAVLRPFL